VRYEDYARGLCLLDPYGLHLNWEVIYRAGQMKSIEVFINFPTMDINRNILTRDKRVVDPRFAEDPARAAKMAERMTAFWGDESWKDIGYSGQQTDLFGGFEKANNDVLAAAFQARLKNVAGFGFVPDPVPMQDKNRTLYYLFFASPNFLGAKIVEDIFIKYRTPGSESS
jgi:three-Cys-motif partner protein